MPTTSYFTASTLDGFLADPDHSLAWLLKQDFDEDGPMSHVQLARDIGALAMGANTYQWVLDHISATGEAWPYEEPCWVFTHRQLDVPEGADIRFVQDDVATVHAAMAEVAGDSTIWLVGGGELVGQFADRGLLDQIVISYAPVTLGAGAPLLPRRLDLELVETARNRNFMCGRYAVNGPLAPG